MYSTDRLQISPLSHADNSFIIELVNTPGWLKYIGNRNVYTAMDAQMYIQSILDNPQYQYWVVNRKEDGKPIGLISLIKRDYLEYHDIGFAFIPTYIGLGYAYEATSFIIKIIREDAKYSTLYATTLPDNKSSIKLLTRLGFTFIETIKPHEEVLNLFKI
ncbi:GNAT family N-acetyltransferase [Myroides odoratimimus]|uniref:GNAT family N-acetyltransferase n=1 Tax=Myroides odoratimimus TaxID=76832 RepID=UPI0038D35FFC